MKDITGMSRKAGGRRCHCGTEVKSPNTCSMMPLIGANDFYAHDATRFEERANKYAGTGTDSPLPWDTWGWWPW